jgi:hypothetical protein
MREDLQSFFLPGYLTESQTWLLCASGLIGLLDKIRAGNQIGKRELIAEDGHADGDR